MAANSTEVTSVARPTKSFPTQDSTYFSQRLDSFSYLFWEDFPDITSFVLPLSPASPSHSRTGPAIPDKGGREHTSQSAQE